MNHFQYAIADEIFAAHSGYCRGLVVFRQVNNHGAGDEWLGLLRQAEVTLRERVSGNPAEHPRIAAWRDAYRRFGAKPSEHRSSIESMVRRVLKPDSLPSINPLVDIGNCLSLRHMLPVGVHPIHGDSADLMLRCAREGDQFLPADGGPSESPTPPEIVFASGNEVLTRRWTWRQAVGTQTTPDANTVFFNIDGLAPCTATEVEHALQDVVSLVTQACGGQVMFAGILDKDRPRVELSFGN